MSNTTDTTAWTYERNFWAHLDGDFVTVPDQVAAEQKAHVGRTFPARAGDGSEVMVTIDAEATGLFTAGTGDLTVRTAPQDWTEIEGGAEISAAALASSRARISAPHDLIAHLEGRLFGTTDEARRGRLGADLAAAQVELRRACTAQSVLLGHSGP